MTLTTAAILFAIGAAGGVAMALMAFKGKAIPTAVAVLHGLLGAGGLVVLASLVMGGTSGGYLKLSLGLFVVAALGGFALFSSHLRGRALSRQLILVHGAVAVVAFLLLLLSL